MSMEAVRAGIVRVIDQHRDRFVGISQEIWAHPELGFEEFRALELLTSPLAEAGFAVETGLAGMETAFRATFGTGEGPVVALLCEYDALKGIGHACGHNLIGAAGVLAGWAVRQAWPDLPGRVQVIGTPAEEDGGGKILMAQQGVFDGVDAAMMFHPTSGPNMVHRGGLACQDVFLTFKGKPAHAASGPWNGLNALDALIQTFVGISMLRQQIKPDARIHGIITRGGDAVNVIPELTEAQVLVRATEAPYLEELMEKVLNCARAGALATGTELSFRKGLFYANRINNMTMARRFQVHLEAMGLTVTEPDPKGGVGSSDIGNVSRICPAIHPYLKIAASGVAGHTDAFREAAGSAAGYEAMIAAAKAMALLTVDLLGERGLLAQAKAELGQALASGQ